MKRLIRPAALAALYAASITPLYADETKAASTPVPAAESSKESGAPAIIDKLVIKDIKAGDGTAAAAGKGVLVHYTGWLYDPGKPDQQGAMFDSSRKGQPFGFTLGAGMVIKGWDEGVAGMKKGGQRTLIIPPDMAYGARGAGGVIPPNATLVFDVELLEVR